MKSYIVTAEIKIDEDRIKRARAWAKRRGYDYKKDVAHMVFDYLTDGVSVSVESVRMEKHEEI